jgi:hypothetical protein
VTIMRDISECEGEMQGYRTENEQDARGKELIIVGRGPHH